MKKKFQNIMLLFLSISIALLFSEFIFRLMVPSVKITEQNELKPLQSLIEFDPILQTRYRPNVSSIVKSQYGEFQIRYTTNEFGLRDKPLNIDDRRSILVLGNSFVEGWGVEEELGFLRVSEQIMNQGRVNPLRLINAGISGFGAAQSYLLGKELLEKTKPIALIFVYLSSMVQADNTFLELADRDTNNLALGLSVNALLNSPAEGNKAISSGPPWLGILAKYSAIAQFTKSYLDAWTARKAIIPGDPMSDLLAGTRADKEKLTSLHTPSLLHVKAMAELAKANGLPFMMIHLPMPHQVSASEWAYGRKAYGLDNKLYAAPDKEIVKNFCIKNGIKCESAHKYIINLASNATGDKLLYYKFDFHPTATGYEAIGGWMAKKIEKMPLLN